MVRVLVLPFQNEKVILNSYGKSTPKAFWSLLALQLRDDTVVSIKIELVIHLIQDIQGSSLRDHV